MKLVRALVLLAPFALAACSQGLGDRCNTDGDCDAGLFCQYSTDPNRGATEGGICATILGNDASVGSDAGIDMNRTGG